MERLLYRAPYCDIIMMGRFDGEISERQLREALLKCRAKYPLTGAHVVQDAEGGAQFIFDDVSEFGIRVVNRKSESEWFELAWNEQKQPFNFSRGPLIRFLLLTSNEISDLVVICHHSICDGLSLTYLLRDIGLFLSQPETRVEPTPLPPLMQEGNLITNLHVGWLYRTMTSRLNRSWEKEKVLFNDDDYEKMYRDYWRSTDVGALQITLPIDATSALISRCHEERVTVNSAVITAFSRAQHELQGDSRSFLRKALVAFDMRRYFKENPGECFGLLAAGVQVNLPSNKGDFWDTARKFNLRIRELLSSPEEITKFMAPLTLLDPTLIDAVYFSAHGSFRNKAARRLEGILLTTSNKPKRSMDVTNVGVVNLQDRSKLKAIYFVPILSVNYEKAIGIVTAGGVMNIVVLYDRSRFGERFAEAFRRAVLANLSSARTSPT